MHNFKTIFMQALPKSWAGKLRTWKQRRRIRDYRKRVVEHRYGNHVFKVQLEDGLAEGWYDHDWPPLPEIELLSKSKLRPGARVFDLGAHQGVVAMMLAAQVESSGLVIAVEANPHNFQAARNNAQLNNFTQIKLIHAAIADRNGTTVFNEGLNGQLDDGTGAYGQFSVRVKTIDEVSVEFGFPDVVFLDIEGAEYMALCSAAKTLASHPDFFVEVHVGCGLEKFGGSVEKILAFFPPDRYQLLIRREQDTSYRKIKQKDPIVADRFFLVAIATQP